MSEEFPLSTCSSFQSADSRSADAAGAVLGAYLPSISRPVPPFSISRITSLGMSSSHFSPPRSSS